MEAPVRALRRPFPARLRYLDQRALAFLRHHLQRVPQLARAIAARPSHQDRARQRRAPVRAAIDELRIYFSSSIGLRSRPTPSIAISATSPCFIHTGGLRAWPTPDGVPVTSTSPGSSVMPWVR